MITIFCIMMANTISIVIDKGSLGQFKNIWDTSRMSDLSVNSPLITMIRVMILSGRSNLIVKHHNLASLVIMICVLMCCRVRLAESSVLARTISATKRKHRFSHHDLQMTTKKYTNVFSIHFLYKMILSFRTKVETKEPDSVSPLGPFWKEGRWRRRLWKLDFETMVYWVIVIV